jgi:hypothetical protein
MNGRKWTTSLEKSHQDQFANGQSSRDLRVNSNIMNPETYPCLGAKRRFPHRPQEIDLQLQGRETLIWRERGAFSGEET